eukprot:6177842-Pleurochrysis_carterae.AAC.1
MDSGYTAPPLRLKAGVRRKSVLRTNYSSVTNGAQELDCGVVLDLEGRQLDSPLPGCVEGDVHANRDRI